MYRVHKEGVPFILYSLAASIVSFLLSAFAPAFFLCTGMLSIITCLLIIYFFRDPKRVMPLEENVALSPADGIVTKIEKVPSIDKNANENDEMLLVSIFLSVFDVHVNRVPITGTVISKVYSKGKFISAMSSECCSENERNLILIKTESGNIFGVEQIAGLIARRIICYCNEGDVLQKGSRFGIIRFGSRVNLYLPLSSKIRVLEGQTVIGSETIIADIEA